MAKRAAFTAVTVFACFVVFQGLLLQLSSELNNRALFCVPALTGIATAVLLRQDNFHRYFVGLMIFIPISFFLTLLFFFRYPFYGIHDTVAYAISYFLHIFFCFLGAAAAGICSWYRQKKQLRGGIFMAESKCSKFYVLVFLILGYLGTQLGFTHVGFPIWLLLTYLTVLICIRLERGKMERSGLWLSAAPLLVLLAQIFGETALPPFAGLAVFGMLVIGMFAAIGGVHYRWRELGFVSDVIGGMLYLPFGHLPAIYRTTWQSLKPKKEGKNKEVLIGVLILLPVLLISLFLLVQSDLLFSKAVRSIEDELRRFPDELLWDLLGAWLIAMLLFSVLNGLFEPWKKRETTVTRRYLTLKTVSVVLVPLIVVYCVFAVSQIYQMVLFYAGDSAYSGYAQYAREGFFTLVCAAGVNLAVVLGCSHFLAQEEKTRRTWKLCSRIFTALTFVVLACSLIRVCGYIGEYGMTRLRIQSLWGILLIFLALCAVMWKLFSPKLRLFPLLLAIIMFGYGGLCFVQSDALIAGYNVRAYLNGEHERVDFNTIECLSEDALVAVKYLRNQLDPGNTAYIARCDEILSRARTAAEEDSWKQITVLQRIWSAE